MGLKICHFLFQWCKGPKATRIFNKKCEEKNSSRNICSGNYGQRWFQMLSTLFSVNIFTQSFHEEDWHYLFWFKTLSTEWISLVHSTVKAVSPSILLQAVTYKSAQTRERAILSAAYTDKLSLYLVFVRASLKGWVSSRVQNVTQVRGFFSTNYEVISQIESPQKLT